MNIKKEKKKGRSLHYILLFYSQLKEMQLLLEADLWKSHDSWDNVKNKEKRIWNLDSVPFI